MLPRPPAPPPVSPIKIGAILSLQGPGAPLGTPERDTLLMLEKSINEAGGVNGKPLKVVVVDDQSEETQARLGRQESHRE